MSRSLLSFCLCLLSGALLAADAPPPDITSLMTAEERRASGIDTLSPPQLDALNAWLLRYRTGETAPVTPSAPARPATATAAPTAAPVPVPSDNFGRPPPPPEDIVTRIAGEFTGWSGRTRFTLENGQVWEQRRGGRWKVNLDRPQVRITQTLLGAYELEVVAEGRSIGVRRIR